VDIPGTDWTYISGHNIADNRGWPNGQGEPILMAWRIGVVGEPQTTRWRTAGAGTRVHHIEIEGLSGAPTVTAVSDNQDGTGSVFTSPALASPGPGYWFCGMSYGSSGPDDGASPFYTMAARAPAVDLSNGFAWGPGDGYGPNSWFGYLKVDGAGTDHVVLDRSATPRNANSPYGWLCGFWPA
jgi:hypothetical protein